ncbi:hypothetical protein Tco_0537867 [Tanacetum coccineum]
MTSSDEQHSQDDEVFTQIQPQITTVTNTNAKFPYLKKGEYDIWAMKMQNFITVIFSTAIGTWDLIEAQNNQQSDLSSLLQTSLDPNHFPLTEG